MNCYSSAVAESTLKSTVAEAQYIEQLLDDIAENGESTGMSIERIPYEATQGPCDILFLAEESLWTDSFSDELLRAIGKVVTNNKMEFITIDIAYTSDKTRPGSLGGNQFRIYRDGYLEYVEFRYKYKVKARTK